MSENDLAGRTVLAIFAHPDDESLACGGTLARLSDAGARVVLLCASRGRKEPSAIPRLFQTAISDASARRNCVRPPRCSVSRRS